MGCSRFAVVGMSACLDAVPVLWNMGAPNGAARAMARRERSVAFSVERCVKLRT